MLGHALVSSSRRRRRDLAVLQTLGFVRPQVAAALQWQATTIAGVAIVVGAPIGVVAGRWSWRLFASGLGIEATAVTSIMSVAATITAALIVANLLAVWPARAAANRQPAAVLRSE